MKRNWIRLALQVWRECRRRAQIQIEHLQGLVGDGNRKELLLRTQMNNDRWAAFTDHELRIFDYYLDIEDPKPSPTRLEMVSEIQAEQSRREKIGDNPSLT